MPSKPENTLELVDTHQIEMFIPILREIDFGDAFLLSMLHWCHIGRRSTPLDYWQVFLLKARSEIVGVSGLYRQSGMATTICWLGWFAVRPRFRRRGLGTAAIHALSSFARTISCEELWFTLIPRIRSLSTFISALILNCSAKHENTRLEKPRIQLISF
jgi:GNAT superfamily N-acetyltransferase